MEQRAAFDEVDLLSECEASLADGQIEVFDGFEECVRQWLIDEGP